MTISPKIGRVQFSDRVEGRIRRDTRRTARAAKRAWLDI